MEHVPLAGTRPPQLSTARNSAGNDVDKVNRRAILALLFSAMAVGALVVLLRSVSGARTPRSSAGARTSRPGAEWLIRDRRRATTTGKANHGRTSEFSEAFIGVVGRGRCKEVTTAEVARVAELPDLSFRPAAPAADGRCANTELPGVLLNGQGIPDVRPLPERLAGGEIERRFATTPWRVTQQDRRTAFAKPPAPQANRGGNDPQRLCDRLHAVAGRHHQDDATAQHHTGSQRLALRPCEEQRAVVCRHPETAIRLVGEAVIYEMHASRSGRCSDEVPSREDSSSTSRRLIGGPWPCRLSC